MGEGEKTPPPVTWNQVKRLFRGIDISMMRSAVSNHVTLDRYNDVKGQAFNIPGMVKSTDPARRMPPPPYAKWTEEMAATFDTWVKDKGLEVDKDLQTEAKPFVDLSELLTGYSGLNNDPDLALKYLERLNNRPDLSATVAELITKHSGAADPQNFMTEVEANPTYKDAASAIILLWYTGGFFDANGFPQDFGSAEDNQFIDGLVWQAIQAHPMGYSTEGNSYWENEPNADGLYSGLGNTATNRPKPAASGPVA